MSLFKNDKEMLALENALRSGKLWGNIIYEEELAERARETSAQRAAREKKEKNNTEAIAILGNIQKKKAKFVNRKGTLKKIAKKCKWECQGQKCWAREGKACPYIHKGEPGWNASSAVTMKKGSSRKNRKTRKNRRN